jgi:hypothetical protein
MLVIVLDAEKKEEEKCNKKKIQRAYDNRNKEFVKMHIY